MKKSKKIYLPLGFGLELKNTKDEGYHVALTRGNKILHRFKRENLSPLARHATLAILTGPLLVPTPLAEQIFDTALQMLS